MSEQERFEETVSHIYSARGYLVIGWESPKPIGYVTGRVFQGDEDDPDTPVIRQPLRVVCATTTADYFEQCRLGGYRPSHPPGIHYYRVESD